MTTHTENADNVAAAIEHAVHAIEDAAQAMIEARAAHLETLPDDASASAKAEHAATLALIAEVAEIDALHEVFYSFDQNTRVHALSRLTETGDDTSGPYHAILRLAGIEYVIDKAEGTGRVTTESVKIPLRDKSGQVISDNATYTPESPTATVPDARKNIAISVGRISTKVAVAANTPPKENKPKESKPRASSAATDARLDSVTNEIAELKLMLAEALKASKN